MADVEVYIESPDMEALIVWVAQRVGEIKFITEDDEMLVYHAQAGGETLPIIIQKVVEDGPFVGIWFNSIYAPWDDDAACGRDLQQALGGVVQCDPGDKVKGDNKFLQIDGTGESIIEL